MKTVVSFPSFGATAAFAMITGTAEADYPVSLLSDLKEITRPFRSDGAGAIAFSFVLTADKAVELVALCHHNAAAGETYRVRLYSDASMLVLVHDSGVLAFDTLDSEDYPPVQPYAPPAGLTVRAGRIDLSDLGEAWQIGGVEVSGLWDLSEHDARSFGLRSSDEVEDIGDSITNATRQFSPRSVSLGLSVIDWEIDGETFQAFQDEKGTDQPLVYVRDLEDADTWTREAALVRNTDLTNLTKDAVTLGKIGLVLVEHLQ